LLLGNPTPDGQSIQLLQQDRPDGPWGTPTAITQSVYGIGQIGAAWEPQGGLWVSFTSLHPPSGSDEFPTTADLILQQIDSTSGYPVDSGLLEPAAVGSSATPGASPNLSRLLLIGAAGLFVLLVVGTGMILSVRGLCRRRS
jgi:hypothetical protein